MTHGDFKPFRRKLGVVTLMAACVFAAGWARSSVVQDHATICYRRSAHTLNSKGGRIQWDLYFDPQEVRFGSGPPTFDWNVYRLKVSAIDTHWSKPQTNWQRGWLGLKVCYGKIRTISGEVHTAEGIVPIKPRMLDLRSFEIPYWSVTIPLSLLSAWLLLSKPRSSQTYKSDEPIAEKVA